MKKEEIYEMANEILSRKINDMTKIKVKCWVHHSISRLKNQHEPFTFHTFNENLGKQTYIDYIRLNLIDCTDIGGKEKAVQVVNHWFG